MTSAFDIVVAGAGSNSLVAAAYMAKAGHKVLVLEKNDQAGGGVVSISIAPGFINDPHASGYYVCMANPAIAQDELGLLSKHGLEFKYWEAGFATIFDDGSTLTAYTDLDRSCAEIAKFSEKDALAYRKFGLEAKSLLPILARAAATPPMPTGAFLGMLETSALGRKLAASMFMSVYELVDHLFESPQLKIHLMKWCAEVMEGPDVKGTAVTLYSLFGLAHSMDAAIPVGGSKSVTNALIRCIEYYGGVVRLNAEVTALDIHAGEVRGVFVGDEQIGANTCVIANIHPWRLKDFIPDIDPDVAEAASLVHLSNHGAINQQIALTEPPQYKAGPQFEKALCVEFVELDVETVRRTFDEYRYGYISGPFVSTYAASKHAIEAMVDSARRETRRQTVKISLIEPGVVKTPMYFNQLTALDQAIANLATKERELYGDLYQDHRKLVAGAAKTAISPDQCCAVIETCLDAAKPRARYRAGSDAKALVGLSRALSDRALDRVFGLIYKG